jgi:2-oxoisovalerate dehydrogenase E2 component (dihydrolipoyl transacylase)
MVTDRQFRLPDLGEGLTEAEIVRWLVSAGDRVTTNQPLLEVETAKAVVEVPSPFTGVVVAVHGAAGETVPVGTALVTVDVAEAGGAPGEADESGGPAGSRRPGSAHDEPRGGDEQQQVLVGYGPRPPAAPARRPRRSRRGAAGVGAAPVNAATPLGPSALLGATVAGGPPAAAHPPAGGGNGAGRDPGPVLAKPPVRKLARDLGVDLRGIVGTGPGGTISRADVEAAAAPAVIPHPTAGTTSPPRPSGPQTAAPGRADPTAPARPGQIPVGARFDPTTRTWLVPVTGVRRATAKAMVASAFTAPHVTEFVSVDMTGTMAARDRLAALPEFADVKVTPLLFVAKALLTAVRRYPAINASWVGSDDPSDPAAQIVMHEAVNLGIAVASPRGLLVPNIPHADRLGLVELAHTLHRLAADARAGRVAPADLTGGTITITNVGVFGVDIGTPILNPGEAAILALGAVRPAPWVHEGQLAVRTVAQLALSFDHRMVDGELGSAVLADVAAMLTDPTVLLAWS